MMRSMIVIIGFLLTGTSSAEVKKGFQSLETYQFRACEYWARLPDTTNMYGCDFFPQRVEVPTARDTARVISELERKISELEARVRALESQR
jgi:hypothetical protein